MEKDGKMKWKLIVNPNCSRASSRASASWNMPAMLRPRRAHRSGSMTLHAARRGSDSSYARAFGETLAFIRNKLLGPAFLQRDQPAGIRSAARQLRAQAGDLGLEIRDALQQAERDTQS